MLVLCCGLLSGCVDVAGLEVDVRIGWFVRLSDESGEWKVVEGPVRRADLSGDGRGSTVLLGYRAEDLPEIEDFGALVGQLRVPQACERTLPNPAWSWTDADSPPESLRLAVGNEWKHCWDTWGCDPTRCETSVVKVSTGEAHACGFDSLGTVYCWAQTNSSETGRDPNAAEHAFEVTTAANDIAVGARHSCSGVRSDTGGRVYCWGAGDKGQTGSNSTDLRSLKFVLSAHGPLLVDLEEDHGCALGGNAWVGCWGDEYGPSLTTIVRDPGPNSGISNVSAFDIGTRLICIISDRAARCATSDVEFWAHVAPFAQDVDLLSVYSQRACAAGESWVKCTNYDTGLHETFDMPNDAKPRDLDLTDAGWCVAFEDGKLHCEHPNLTTDRLPADIRVRPYPDSISLSKDNAACLILSDQSVRCIGTTTSTLVPLPRPN